MPVPCKKGKELNIKRGLRAELMCSTAHAHPLQCMHAGLLPEVSFLQHLCGIVSEAFDGCQHTCLVGQDGQQWQHVDALVRRARRLQQRRVAPGGLHQHGGQAAHHGAMLRDGKMCITANDAWCLRSLSQEACVDVVFAH